MGGRVLALAVASVLALAPAALADVPSIQATPNAAGEVVVTWTIPSGHTSTNLHWSTDPATVPTPASDPSEGSQMACFASGPANGVHNCTGGTDLGSTQATYTIRALPPGSYYAQVMTYGTKQWLDTANNVQLTVHYYGYSAVVPFTVSAPVKSSPATTTTTTAPAGPTGAPLTRLVVPKQPPSNGTADCRASRAMLQGVIAQARRLNVTIAGLKGLTAAGQKRAVGLIALAQRLVDEAARDATKWCSAVTSGGYGTLPPDNGTAACRSARAHVQAVNAELKKAYGNLAFATPADGSKWVRIQQLQTRIKRLLADLDRSVPVAIRACAAG